MAHQAGACPGFCSVKQLGVLDGMLVRCRAISSIKVASAFNRTRHLPSSGGYSVESRRVYLTFKNSPERNSRGLLILLRRVLFQGSHLLQILLKALGRQYPFIHMGEERHCESKVSQDKNTIQYPRPRFKPRLLNQETSAH